MITAAAVAFVLLIILIVVLVLVLRAKKDKEPTTVPPTVATTSDIPPLPTASKIVNVFTLDPVRKSDKFLESLRNVPGPRNVFLNPFFIDRCKLSAPANLPICCLR